MKCDLSYEVNEDGTATVYVTVAIGDMVKKMKGETFASEEGAKNHITYAHLLAEAIP